LVEIFQLKEYNLKILDLFEKNKEEKKKLNEKFWF
jgi:hypothetical protein